MSKDLSSLLGAYLGVGLEVQETTGTGDVHVADSGLLVQSCRQKDRMRVRANTKTLLHLFLETYAELGDKSTRDFTQKCLVCGP